MSFYNRDTANPYGGSVNNVNNTQLYHILQRLPEEPLLLQVPQLYAQQRVVRRPHWQQQPQQQVIYQQPQLQQITQQQQFQPQPQPQPLHTQQEHLYPQLHPSSTPQSQQVYSPQIEDDGDASEKEGNDTEKDGDKPAKKKGRQLRRRKAKKANPSI